LLLIAPLAVLALVAAGGVVLTFLTSASPGQEPGPAVAIEVLPENDAWVVKVYESKGLYLAHVYINGEYKNHQDGFSTIQRAIDWGFEYARERL